MTHTPQSVIDSTERKDTTTSPRSESASSVDWTDISKPRSPVSKAAVTEVPATPTNSTGEELTVPEVLPDPEVTLFRDTTSVIRFLEKQRTETQFELRLYHVDDKSVEHIVTEDNSGPDHGANSRIDALPETARRRFVRAVDLVTERFPLSLTNTEAYGTCRHRRPNHGFCGILEFSVTLQADESSNHW